MKQLFLHNGSVILKDVAPPVVGTHDILVDVAYSFVSAGTERATVKASSMSLARKFLGNTHMYWGKVRSSLREHGIWGTTSLIAASQNRFSDLGYSLSGRVVARGDKVTSLRVGDFVACGGAGHASHAQRVVVPENLAVKLSSARYLRESSITTIGSIALQGVRRSNVRLGDIVCVVGLGLIGQLTVQLLRNAGCTVIGVDLDSNRLKYAYGHGAQYVFDPQSISLKREIDFITEHYGVDATIITAGSSSGALINQAMDITRRRGKVVLVGDVRLDFDRELFYAKEIDFLISCSYGPGRYDVRYEGENVDYPYAYVRWTQRRNMAYVARCIERGALSLENIISQEFPVDRAPEAYAALRGVSNLGIVLSYPRTLADPARVVSPAKIPATYTYPATKLRVGIIGAGGFAKVTLLPAFRACKAVELSYLVDTHAAQALSVAKTYGIAKTSSRVEDLVASNVDLAVIASPHAFHAAQARACLTSGKAVFLEKPAVVTLDELYELIALLKANPKCCYTVDFNRSFAPFNQVIAKKVALRNAPAMITYRLNGGFIPRDAWMQLHQHGGRIIGEACHMFELFCTLTGSRPVSLSVQSLATDRDDVLSNDNCSVSVRFADGSLATLVYTALGDTQLSKERMEVFFDGTSIVMDDYITLTGYGIMGINTHVRQSDKGHNALISAFVAHAKSKGAPRPIPFERIVWASALSIIADELARSGGGTRDIPADIVNVHFGEQ